MSLRALYAEERRRWALRHGAAEPATVPLRMHPDTFTRVLEEAPDAYDAASGFVFGHPVVLRGTDPVGRLYLPPVFADAGPIRFEGGMFHGLLVPVAAWKFHLVCRLGERVHVYELVERLTDGGARYLQYELTAAEADLVARWEPGAPG